MSTEPGSDLMPWEELATLKERQALDRHLSAHGLTARQKRVLASILWHYHHHGTWPSQKQVRDHIGIKSVNAASGYINRLIRKGRLLRRLGKAHDFETSFIEADICLLCWRNPDGKSILDDCPG